MKKKFDYKYCIIALLVVGLIAVAVLFKITSDKHTEEIETLNKEISDRDDVINALQVENDALGETVTVYATARDVRSNSQVTVEDLVQIEVPVSLANGYCTKAEDIIGKYFYIDMAKGTPVANKDVFYVALQQDDRYLDIACDRQPIGLKKGDTVDVRVSCPDGQDFLLLEGKLVHSVYGNVVNILADEKDIIIYKSMEADWCRFYKGSEVGKAMMVYVVNHVQGAIQSGERFYPIADVLPDGVTYEGSTLWTAINDLNLEGKELKDWTVTNRSTFEKSLEMYDWYRTGIVTYAVRVGIDVEVGDKLMITNEWGQTEEVNLRDYTLEQLKKAMYVEGADEILEKCGLVVGEDEIGYVIQCREDEDFIDKIESTYQHTKVLSYQVYDKVVSVDMTKGSAKVAEAKTARDQIYQAAVALYELEQVAKIEAKIQAEQEGWLDEWDEDNWEYIYMKHKLEQDREGEVADGQIF